MQITWGKVKLIWCYFKVVVLTQGSFCPPPSTLGNTWHGLETFLVVSNQGRDEARDAAKTSCIVQRQAPSLRTQQRNVWPKVSVVLRMRNPV